MLGLTIFEVFISAFFKTKGRNKFERQNSSVKKENRYSLEKLKIDDEYSDSQDLK